MLSYFEGVKKYGIDISLEMAKMSKNKGIEGDLSGDDIERISWEI